MNQPAVLWPLRPLGVATFAFLLAWLAQPNRLQAQKEIVIDATKAYQAIDGIGASDCWSGDFVGRHWSSQQKAAIAKLLFARQHGPDGQPEGIGLSLWRFNIGAGSARQGAASYIDDETRRSESFLTGVASNGTYRVTLKASGKALSLDEGRKGQNGADVLQWDWWGGQTQQWVFTQVAQDEYTIANAHGGKCLEVADWGTANGDNIRQWACGGNNKVWKLVPLGNYQFHIINKHSGKALSIHGHESGRNGASALQWDNLGHDNFVWQLALLQEGPPLAYDWGKQSGQQWFLRQANAYGVEKFVAFSNSPPITMTRNNIAHPFKGAGGRTANLLPQKYDDFARYLADVVRHFNAQGIHFDYLSPVNEPQYAWDGNGQEGSPWANADVKKLAGPLSQRLRAHGLATKILLTEAGDWEYLYKPKGNPATSDQIKNFFSPSSPHYLGGVAQMPKIIGAHSYWLNGSDDQIRATRQAVWQKAQAYGLALHQTEYSALGFDPGSPMDIALHFGKILYADFAIANVASWSFWTAMERERWGHKNRFSLIEVRPPDGPYGDMKKSGTHQAQKSLWALGHYSRFVRPGYRRVALSGADDLGGLMGTAFLAPDGSEIVAVYANLSDAAIPIRQAYLLPNGKAATLATPFVTDRLRNLAKGPVFGPNSQFLIPKKALVTLQIPLIPSSRTVVTLKKRGQPFMLDGNQGSHNGQRVVLWEPNPSDNQKWEEISHGGGYYSYVIKGTAYALYGQPGGANGQPVVLRLHNPDSHGQHWKKIPVDGGFFRLQKRDAPAFSLDGDWRNKNGQPVLLWASDHKNHHQHWRIAPTENQPMAQARRAEGRLRLQLYPNPVGGVMSITGLPHDCNGIRLYQNNGMALPQPKVSYQSQKAMVNTESLPPGFYYLKILTPNDRIPLRFVKR